MTSRSRITPTLGLTSTLLHVIMYTCRGLISLHLSLNTVTEVSVLSVVSHNVRIYLSVSGCVAMAKHHILVDCTTPVPKPKLSSFFVKWMLGARWQGMRERRSLHVQRRSHACQTYRISMTWVFDNRARVMNNHRSCWTPHFKIQLSVGSQETVGCKFHAYQLKSSCKEQSNHNFIRL